LRLRPAALLALLAACCVVAAAPTPARADRVADAREHYKRGMAAYGLGNYSEAATEYEAAFKLEPDSALLYNAAQAHRLGGNSERALELYQSYLRLFGAQISNRSEVERHIAGLKTAIAAQKSASSSPPVTPHPMSPATGTAPASSDAAPAPDSATTPTSATAPTAMQLTASPSARDTATRKPWWKRGWVWGVVGGSVAAVGLGVGLGLGLQSHDPPHASQGMVTF
jgi:tetratricopeptide (TPR) repeat protein